MPLGSNTYNDKYSTVDISKSLEDVYTYDSTQWGFEKCQCKKQ